MGAFASEGVNWLNIKAIETSYKGYRFRSRLEARWAVFFDELGIKWEYEKEGYDLTDAYINLLALFEDRQFRAREHNQQLRIAMKYRDESLLDEETREMLSLIVKVVRIEDGLRSGRGPLESHRDIDIDDIWDLPMGKWSRALWKVPRVPDLIDSFYARYLPDFWLPQMGFWAEVKPDNFSLSELQKCFLLAHYTERPCLLLEGMPTFRPYEAQLPFRFDDPHFRQRSKLEFGLTPRCRSGPASALWFCVGMQKEGEGDVKSDTLSAIDAARSARFEYGEVGSVRNPTPPTRTQGRDLAQLDVYERWEPTIAHQRSSDEWTTLDDYELWRWTAENGGCATFAYKSGRSLFACNARIAYLKERRIWDGDKLKARKDGHCNE